jgi:acetyltransferase-like isoleucine patch superfamily enzyme
MIKFYILKFISYLKKYKLKSNARIHDTSRLLKGFDITWLSHVENRFYVTIGKNCILNAKIVFEDKSGEVTIGDRCYIGYASNIISRNNITIGNDVTIAWNVTIYDHDSHSINWKDRSKVVRTFFDEYGKSICFKNIDWNGVKSAPIKIEDKVWIGFDVVILKGVTIGEGAIIGARSLVTKNVEPYTIVAGNPAKFIKNIDKNL